MKKKQAEKGYLLRNAHNRGKDVKSLASTITKQRATELVLRKQRRKVPNNHSAQRRNELLLSEVYNVTRSFKATGLTSNALQNVSIQDASTALDSEDEQTRLGAIGVLEALAEANPSVFKDIVQSSLYLKLLQTIRARNHELALAAISLLAATVKTHPECIESVVLSIKDFELLVYGRSLQQTNLIVLRQVIYFITLLETSDSTSDTLAGDDLLQLIQLFLQYAQPPCVEARDVLRPNGSATLDERVAVHLLASQSEHWATESQNKPLLFVIDCLFKIPDLDVVVELCRGLSTALHTPNFANVTEQLPDVGHTLVKFLDRSNDPNVQYPIIKTLADFMIYSSAMIEKFLGWDLLDALRLLLLGHVDPSVRKLVCWTVGIIACHNEDTVQAIIDGNLVPPLLNIASSPLTGPELKREAGFVICSIIDSTSVEKINYMVSQGCIPPLANDMLLSMNNDVIVSALTSLERILNAGKEVPDSEFAFFIEEALGVRNINALCFSENPVIFEISNRILDEHFPDDKVEMVPPAPSSNNTPEDPTGSIDEQMSDLGLEQEDELLENSGLKPKSTDESYVFQTEGLSNKFTFS